MKCYREKGFSHQDKPTQEGKPFFRRKEEIRKKGEKEEKREKESIFIRKSSKRNIEYIYSEK